MKVSPRILPKIVHPHDINISKTAFSTASMINASSPSSIETSKSVATSRGASLMKQLTQINKSVDNSFANIASSPPRVSRLRTSKTRDPERTKERDIEIQDPLDISSDSLENLFVTGTAPTSMILAREHSSKNVSSVSSRTSNRRSNHPNSASTANMNANTHSTSLIVYSSNESTTPFEKAATVIEVNNSFSLLKTFS